MKAWLILFGSVMFSQASSAQLVPSDTVGCVRPTAQVASCSDTRLPARLCIAEIDTAIKEMASWEQCVADQMQERHSRERKALTERAAERRTSLLQSIILTAR